MAQGLGVGAVRFVDVAGEGIVKVLSVRQPWAAFMFVESVPQLAALLPRKDVENRTWGTDYRGWLLIHAAQKVDRGWAQFVSERFHIVLPDFEARLGGIIGSVKLVDCVTESKSRWFTGPYGFVLARPFPLPFEACPGKLGLWDK